MKAEQNVENLRDGLLRLFKSQTDWGLLSREAKNNGAVSRKWANAWAGIIESGVLFASNRLNPGAGPSAFF